MNEYGEHESTDDPLQVLRHSAAHLLAAAVTELYPDTKYGIGPAVQDGFYYDFQFSKPVQRGQAVRPRDADARTGARGVSQARSGL